MSPASIASTSSSRTQPIAVAFEHLGEAELPLVEAQEFVEPDVGQSGDQRDAVADLLDPADLFGPRAERGGAELGAGAFEPGVRRAGQGRSSWARSARIWARSARQLLLTTRWGPRNSKPGDEGRVRLEGDLRIGVRTPRAISLRQRSCSVGIERRRADRFECCAGRRHGLPRRVRQAPGFP